MNELEVLVANKSSKDDSLTRWMTVDTIILDSSMGRLAIKFIDSLRRKFSVEKRL